MVQKHKFQLAKKNQAFKHQGYIFRLKSSRLNGFQNFRGSQT